MNISISKCFLLILPILLNISIIHSSTEANLEETTPGNIPENTNGNSSNSNATTSGLEVVPLWIQTERGRATKLLEKPLETQLNFQNFVDEAEDHQSAKIPVVRVAGVQKQDKTGVIGELGDTKNKKESSKRQDLTKFETEPLTFTSVVSPIEGTLGGFTGLQGLTPISVIQLTKLLIATMPFIIPMIFVPLLIFTIGLLMLPINRSNVFVDVGHLRSYSSKASMLSDYVITPVKRFTGNVVMPRAYQFANNLVDHEECVERISCEISARYLHHNGWDGSWPSVVNKGWISRMLNYFGGSNSTATRIAKSLNVKEQNGANFADRVDGGETGRNLSTNDTTCVRYTCQPKGFMRKLIEMYTQNNRFKNHK